MFPNLPCKEKINKSANERLAELSRSHNVSESRFGSCASNSFSVCEFTTVGKFSFFGIGLPGAVISKVGAGGFETEDFTEAVVPCGLPLHEGTVHSPCNLKVNRQLQLLLCAFLEYWMPELQTMLTRVNK